MFVEAQRRRCVPAMIGTADSRSSAAPAVRQKVAIRLGGMLGDAREHIPQVGFGIKSRWA
jgi:hypothetical protein